MYSGKCYIDDISRRGKIPAPKVLDMCFELERNIWMNITDIVYELTQSHWRWGNSNQSHKRELVSDLIKYYIQKNAKCDAAYIAPSLKQINKYIFSIIEICDCALNTHRDEDMVVCLYCGELIKNNSRHNIKYCNFCKNHKPYAADKSKICPDCGGEFIVDINNHRQYRCDKCQLAADKTSTRERVRKCRERKQM